MTPLITIERPPCTLRVREDASAAVTGALVRGEGCVAHGRGGRGGTLLFPMGEDFGVLRRYRRGGMLARMLPKCFLRNRMRAESEIHAFLEASGAPVPELLGVCWRRRGLGYHGAIATRLIDAPTLLEWLAAQPEDAKEGLRACGVAIRRVHDLGVLHADLNAANILIAAQGPLLIDFDGAKRRDGLGRRQRVTNLLRLRRSLRKAGYPDVLFEAILEGYGDVRFPRDMILVDALRCWLRGHTRRKEKAGA